MYLSCLGQAYVDLLEPEILQLGDTSSAVQMLQLILRELKLFRGEANGIFCPATAAAISALQERLGLPVTGDFDIATWYALTFWNDMAVRTALVAKTTLHQERVAVAAHN